jgi:hypothetical protein
MRRSLFSGARALAVIAAALVGGCYESELPLDPAPQAPVDESWLGTWRCLPFNADADEDPVTVAVKRAPDERYGITWLESGKAPERYAAFASSVGDARLLNVQEVKAGAPDGKWVYVKPTLLRPNVIQVQIVNDDALDGVAKTAPAVRGAIERQLKSPSLLVDFCVCVRAKNSGDAAASP